MSDSKYSLIVVSNRLPFVLKGTGNSEEPWSRKSSAGGLVTAVAPVVVESGGSWVGWPGVPLDQLDHIPESSPDDTTPTAGLKSEQVVAVNVTEEQHELYYNGMCNGTLWPLFHSMSDRAVFDQTFYDAYKEVNGAFAVKTLEALKASLKRSPDKTPVVWIQDYHLLLAAQQIRQLAREQDLHCILAFFLHIPFPSFDLFKILPWENEILEGMLGCDVIGFHDSDYCDNFLFCCQRALGYCTVDGQSSSIVERNDGRFVFVKDMPISIPYDRFESLARKAPEHMDPDVQVILGVDRLDYTKGLPNRLRAYERLLEDFPQHREKVMLLQVAVPSRTDVPKYQELREEMNRLVGDINGKYSTPKWAPIRYIFGCVSQADLAGYYRDADIGLITPLRDGMNLVAKEFVACRVRKPGVLILSPFAGAGRHMEEALLVNPYETGNVSQALHRALTMDENERRVRMNGLRARETTHDVNHWMRLFLDTVQNFSDTAQTLETRHNRDFEMLLRPVLKQYKRVALLLDFDGTLSPLMSHPDLAVLPQGTKEALQRLNRLSQVSVAIISGRQVDDVKDKVGLDDVTYSGSHGHVIHHADGAIYEHRYQDRDKLVRLADILKEKVIDQFEGAWLENKTYTLCVHIRYVQKEEQPRVQEIIEEEAKALSLSTLPGHASVEVKPLVTADKGTAVQHILRHNYGDDWPDRAAVVYIGDDTTDEDAMRVLADAGKGGVSFRVLEDRTCPAARSTAASHILPDTRSVVHLLHWLYGQLQQKDGDDDDDDDQTPHSHGSAEE